MEWMSLCCTNFICSSSFYLLAIQEFIQMFCIKFRFAETRGTWPYISHFDRFISNLRNTSKEHLHDG